MTSFSGDCFLAFMIISGRTVKAHQLEDVVGKGPSIKERWPVTV